MAKVWLLCLSAPDEPIFSRSSDDPSKGLKSPSSIYAAPRWDKTETVQICYCSSRL